MEIKEKDYYASFVQMSLTHSSKYNKYKSKINKCQIKGPHCWMKWAVY